MRDVDTGRAEARTCASRHALALSALVLASLASCTLPGAPVQRGVSLDCRHFYPSSAGVWQADGNATAVVNGRQ